MFEKIFGKKKSIHRSLFVSLSVAIICVIVLSIIGFYIFVNNQALSKLVEFNLETSGEVEDLLFIIRRSILLIITNTILTSAIIIKIATKKMLQPIQKLNEATKEVAQGNFDIELETNREDEIGELTTNFNKMVKDLSSIEHLQKDFINNVSHEVKTPISSIQGFSTLLAKDNLSPEERKEYSDIIKEESDRLLNITANILKLSKLQNQNEIMNKEQINIAEQIRKAIQLLEPKWSEKELIFDVSLEEKYFIGDEELIFQIWVNLIDNAIKFSNQNGKIEITLKENNNCLEVRIKDNGVGIKKEEKEKIFTKFYQIDKSHSTEGSGLGLVIVKRIIELSNGEIEVESKENEGTTMLVKLPIENKNNKIVIV